LRAGDEAPRYAKRASASKLDPYADKLATWFAIEATKSRKQRRNLRQIHTKENIKRLSTPRSLGAHKSGGSVFNGNLRSEIGGIKQAANPPVRVPRLTSLICFTARRGSARRRRIPQPIALLGEAVETCGHSLLADRGQDPVAISSLRWKMRVPRPSGNHNRTRRSTSGLSANPLFDLYRAKDQHRTGQAQCQFARRQGLGPKHRLQGRNVDHRQLERKGR
jgi:hypothetical protein